MTNRIKYGVYKQLRRVKNYRQKRMQWRFHIPQAMIEVLGWGDGDKLYLVKDGDWLKIRRRGNE